MKFSNLFTFLALFLFSAGLTKTYSQVDSVKYILTFDEENCVWDVNLYIQQGEATAVPHRIQFNSQISIVYDTSLTINGAPVNYNPIQNNFNYNGTEPMVWQPSTMVSSPAADPVHNYQSYITTSSPTALYNDLFEGDTVKLFSLDITPITNCGSGVRFFENGVDPSSNAPGMQGGNFSNGFTLGGPLQKYNGNLPTVYPKPPKLSSTYQCTAGVEIDLTASYPACQTTPTYQWSGPNGFSSTSEDVSIIPAQASDYGTYTVTVTSSIGCTAVHTVEAVPPPDAGVDQIACQGASVTLQGSNPSDGTWTASASNPSGATLTSGQNGQATVDFDNTASGDYTFIYDNGVCSDNMVVTVVSPDAGPDPSPVSCFSDGTATLSASGTGTWSIDAGNSAGTATISDPMDPNATVSNFSVPGDYTLVWDAGGGCTDFVVISVQDNCGCGIMDNTISLSPTTYCGNTGSLTIDGVAATPSGGTYLWEYSMNNGPFAAAPGSNTSEDYTTMDLSAGTHQFRRIYSITSPVMCSDTSNVLTINVVDQPSTPVLTANPNPACLGQTVDLSIDPAPGASISWSASSTDAGLASSTTNTNTMTPTVAGTYTITVTVSTPGCPPVSGTVDVEVIDTPPTPSNVSSTDPTACGVADGTITLPGYTPNTQYTVEYNLNGNITSTNITADAGGEIVINGLSAGQYSDFVVSISSACPSMVFAGPVVLSDPGAPNPATGLTASPNPVCQGEMVTFTVDAESGATFNWSGSPSLNPSSPGNTNTASATANTVGTFVVSVTKVVSGCESQPVSITVEVIAAPNVPNITSTNPSGCGTNDGTITLSGLTPNEMLNLQYTFNGGNVDNDYTVSADGMIILTGLAPGAYSGFQLTNSTGCSTSINQTITITDPQSPVITNLTASPNPVCPDDTVIISADNIPGAVFDWSYSPQDGSSFLPNGNTVAFDPAGTGDYTISLSVTLNGCGSSTQTLIVTALETCDNASITSCVWEDLNGNGVFQFNEPGIPDVVVTMFNSDDIALATTMTNAQGYYTFDEVPPGNYYFEFIAPEQYEPTTPNVGNEANDSDVDDSNGPNTTALFTLTAGNDLTDVKAGYIQCINIGDLVWYDFNENDVWDPTENGIDGIHVILYKKVNGVWIEYDDTYTGHKPGTPSDDGWFNFCVPPGTYYVEVVMPPQGLVQALPNIGFNEEYDSDLTNAFGPGTTNQFTVNTGQDKTDLGAGFYPQSIVGNLVWFDENFDGIQNSNEAKLAGITVQAIDKTTNQVIKEVTTNDNGIYQIGYLDKKQVYFKFMPPENYVATIPKVGFDNIDSDADHSNGLNTTKTFNLNPGNIYDGIDFGVAYGALPVNWVDVNVKNIDKGHKITWTVEQEINLDFYQVERRFGDSKFVPISSGKVEAHNVKERSIYSVVDGDVSLRGTYFYRVKQVDFDGKVNYSRIVSLKAEGDGTLRVLPNPSTGLIKVTMDNSQESDVNFVVRDELGKIVYTEKMLLDQGQNEINLDLSNLAAGTYVLSISSEYSTMKKKILIVK